jgi:hypothetical protein
VEFDGLPNRLTLRKPLRVDANLDPRHLNLVRCERAVLTGAPHAHVIDRGWQHRTLQFWAGFIALPRGIRIRAIALTVKREYLS